MPSQFLNNRQEEEYKGLMIQHVKNNACADYDLPEGMDEGWRVITPPPITNIVHTATSREDAKAWIDEHFSPPPSLPVSYKFRE